MYNLVKTEQKQIGKKEKIHIKNNINKNIKNNSNYSGSLNEATHFSSFRGKIGYKMIPF